MTLKEAIEGCTRSERRAQEWLYKFCYEKYFPTCYRYFNHIEQAKEMVNSGFISLLYALESFDHNLEFDPWARRIFVNQCLDEIRAQNRHQEKYTHLHPEAWEYVKNQVMHVPADTQSYWVWINELPESEKIVFNLFAIDGFSHKEICDQLNISERSSKRYLQQARMALREKIEKSEKRTVKVNGDER